MLGLNDELVYAILGLLFHWRLGWWAARVIKTNDTTDEWVSAADEVGLAAAALFLGTLMAVIVFIGYVIAPKFQAWHDAGGRLFQDNEENDHD